MSQASVFFRAQIAGVSSGALDTVRRVAAKLVGCKDGALELNDLATDPSE